MPERRGDQRAQVAETGSGLFDGTPDHGFHQLSWNHRDVHEQTSQCHHPRRRSARVVSDIGGVTWFNGSPRQGPQKLASVNDGLSNTMMFGESAHGKLSQTFPRSRNNGSGYRATPGLVGRLGFRRRHHVDLLPHESPGADSTVLPGAYDQRFDRLRQLELLSAGRLQFCLRATARSTSSRNTVNCWNSLLIQRDANCIPIVPPTLTAGIYQCFSTRNGDELVGGSTRKCSISRACPAGKPRGEPEQPGALDRIRRVIAAIGSGRSGAKERRGRLELALAAARMASAILVHGARQRLAKLTEQWLVPTRPCTSSGLCTEPAIPRRPSWRGRASGRHPAWHDGPAWDGQASS